MIKPGEEESIDTEVQETSSEPITPPVPGQEGEKGGVPWESFRSLGFFRSLAETWTLVMFSPRQLFGVMQDPGASWTVPLAYAVIIGTIGTFLSLPGLYLVGSSWWGNLGYAEGGISQGIILVLLFVAPVISFFKVLIASGIFHIFIVWLGGTKGWGNIVRVVAYSESPEVLKVVPYLGGMAANIYKIVLLVKGFREAQGLSTARSVFVFLAPVVMVFLLVLLVTGLLIVSATSLLVWE